MLEGLPAGLLERDATELASLLGGPTLIHVPGDAGPPLFVSVLLHGNETSGWNGMRALLQQSPRLRRSLFLFIGNVQAAAAGLRLLPGQQDYNRIWKDAGGPEGRLAAELKEWLARVDLFAAVDLHNNTGQNPHYSVLAELEPGNLGLAGLFSDNAVLVLEPDTVLALVFRDHCPAATLELGPIGDPACDDRAMRYVSLLSSLDAIPPAPESLTLYRSLGRLHVVDSVEFSFAEESRATPLVLADGMEAENFQHIPVGTPIGTTRLDLAEAIRVLDPAHRDVTTDYLQCEDGWITTLRPLVPAMYTTDPLVIRQDCLCYFMEPIAL